MTKITTGSSYGISKKQALLCQLVADGTPKEEIIGMIWGEKAAIRGSKARAKALHEMRMWLNDPAVRNCYHDIMRPALLVTATKAFKRVDTSIDSDDKWLAYNAARDTLNKYGDMLTGEDSNAVTIKIEGMPELGTPKEEEDEQE